MIEDEILSRARALLDEHQLSAAGWDLVIVDDIEQVEGAVGFTDHTQRRIFLARPHLATRVENIHELIHHEVAHALTDGPHDLVWWQKLIDIGGTGAWLDEHGNPEPWSWTEDVIRKYLAQ